MLLGSGTLDFDFVPNRVFRWHPTLRCQMALRSVDKLLFYYRKYYELSFMSCPFNCLSKIVVWKLRRLKYKLPWFIGWWYARLGN
jgi:hypothetical protein